MDYQIYAGSEQISNTTGQDVRTSLTLTSGLVNSIINTMPTVTTRTLQLRVITRDSSGTQVGTTQTKNFSVSLNNTNTRPTLTNVQASVAGSGTDSSKGIYVQGISRLYASFVTNAGYGATIKSRSITVSGQSFGSQHSTNSNRYDGNSNILNNTGSLTVTYKATNSRDQTTSTTRTISVLAYSPPRITIFNGARRTTTSTTIDVNRASSFSNLGGNNSQTAKIDRKQSTSSTWSEIWSLTTTTSINNTTTSTGNAETVSYDFRFTVTDEFGNTARSIITVASAKVLMHYLKNDSVGIGRYSQGQAQLEVGGDLIVDGNIRNSTGRIAATLENGFKQYDWGDAIVGYYKVANIVHLVGLVSTSGATKTKNITVFTLPTGFRPGPVTVFNVEGQNSNRVRIDVGNTGKVNVNDSFPSNLGWISFHGISFVAEN